jgi:predicted histone-like DNA-binding protein
MALKVKAKQKLQKVGKYADTYRFVLSPELYIALAQNKVISEAALRSGISKGVMQACWDAAGEVIKAWATEGHSVALPGLGTMRFGLRAKSVATVDEVKSKLITSRKIVFTPSTDLKDELANTAIQITCYDKDGNVLKRVTSTDEGIVEDPEGDETGEGDGKTGDNENENENQNGGSTNPEPGTVNPEPGTGGGGTGDGTDES